METNNKLTIRMSESGHCVRALVAKYSNQYQNIERPAPSWLQEAADEGNMHELWIKDWLRSQGYNVFDEQLELKLEYDNFILLGHIDGKCAFVDENYNVELLEIKSMSEYEFQRWMRGKFEEFHNYKSQLSCYVTATGLDNVRYIVKNRSSGYKDVNVLKKLDVSDALDNVLRKCEKVHECLTDGTLPECDYDSTKLECRRCSFDQLCIPTLTPNKILASEADLITATASWRSGEKLINEGESLQKIAKLQFKQQMEAAEIKKFQCNNLAIQLIDVKASVMYPKKNLLSKFSEEELQGCEEIKKGYSFLRIEDKNKEPKIEKE
jgi:hypothetical protein